MELVLFVTADYANIERPSGKMHIIGIFDRIHARSFPMTYRRVALAVKLRADPLDHHEPRALTIELVDEDGHSKARINMKFTFPRKEDGSPGSFNFVTEFHRIPLNHPGFYEFRLVIDDEYIGRTPIQAVQIGPPPAQPSDDEPPESDSESE